MLFTNEVMEEKGLLDTAAKMCVAARTAPKAKGKDYIVSLVLTGEDKDKLADKMDELGAEYYGEKGPLWYGRDAQNVRDSQALVLIGSHRTYRYIRHCSFCGHADCDACKEAGTTCAHVTMDLGIALSSAAKVAADHNVDNRMMFSAGKAAAEMNYIEGDILWIGIPINVSGKNIFFDR